MSGFFIHVGCGLTAPEGWRNFDASPTLRLQRMPFVGRFFRRGVFPDFPENVELGDVVRGLPVPDESCRAVYSSHVLEHLAFTDLRVALAEIRRCLEPGGFFRLVVPDLETEARRYLASNSETAAVDFMMRTGLGVEVRPRRATAFLRDQFGNSRHLWMWDYRAIRLELERAGFSRIRRAVAGDSEEHRFTEVEDEGRWRDALGVECVKAAYGP